MQSAIATHVRPLYGFFERQTALMRRYWMFELAWFFYCLASVMAIGYLAVGMEKVAGTPVPKDKVLVYLLTGSLLWNYMSVVFWETANLVTWERWEGTLEYTFMAPVPRATHLAGMALFGVIYGFAYFVVLSAAASLIFHINLAQANLFTALVVLLASVLPLVGLGMMAASLPLLSPEKGMQMTTIIEALLLMVSGVYYPVSVLPSWLQVISKAVPTTYTLQGMRKCLLQGAGLREVLPEIGLLLAIGAVLIPLGGYVFFLTERYCKRVGLLKRSG